MNTPNNPIDVGFPETNLLEKSKKYPVASKGKRFANYLIDTTIVNVFFFSFFIIVGLVMGFTMPEADVAASLESPGLSLLINISAIFIYPIYYLILEGIFKGKTIGKLLTKTRAIDEDYEKMNGEQLVKRSFSRMIPFEAFSYLGDRTDGWHDRISDTIVVEDHPDFNEDFRR